MLQLGLLLALTANPAFAGAPPLCAEVCAAPEGYAFRTTESAKAIQAAEHSFRVVVLETVDTPAGRWGSPTEAKLEQTWESWASKPSRFNPAEDVLIVLGLDEREVRVKTGSRWDADYGFWGKELQPFIDNSFIPRAKAGDLDGGLARLVTAIDAELTARVVRKQAVDARRAAISAAGSSPGVFKVPDALKLALPLTEARRGELLYTVIVVQSSAEMRGASKAFAADLLAQEASTKGMGERTTLVIATLDEQRLAILPPPQWRDVRARSGALGDDVDASLIAAIDAMEQTYAETQQRRDELERTRAAALQQQEEARIAAEQERDAAHARNLRLLVALLLALASLLPFAVLVLQVTRVVFAKRDFWAALDGRIAALATAQQNLVDLHLDVELRDELVALKLKGPVTLARVEQVSDQIATLQAGLAALDEQVVALRSKAPRFAVRASPWKRLTAELDGVIAIDTGEAQARLFAGPTRVIEVHPSAFMAELDLAFAEARSGWQRIRDAANVALHRAADDLSDADLQTMRAQLADAQLPQSWLATHPLVPSAPATWARLDAIRVADPVRYLDALDDAIREDDELEQIIAELIGWKQAVADAWERVHAGQVNALPTAFADPSLAPSTRARALQELSDAFTAALLSGKDLEGVRDLGEAFTAAASEHCEHQAAVRVAVTDGAERLARAARAVADTQAKRATHAATLAQLLRAFVPSALADASREREELAVNVAEAEQALAEAKAHWAAGQHFEAVQAAKRALDEVAQAEADLADLVRLLGQAQATRATAESLWEQIHAARSEQSAALASYGEHALGLSLAQGDSLLTEVRLAWDDGPADWAQRVVALKQVQASWSGAVASAAAKKAEHDAALERARAARAAAQRAAAASHRASRSSSSYSSSSSRSSSYSSSRSSGSSYSSSSRSSGSSYSSGGRSAGGKW